MRVLAVLQGRLRRRPCRAAALCAAAAARQRQEREQTEHDEKRHKRDTQTLKEAAASPERAAELTVPSANWRAYLLANPINAWIGGNTGAASAYFAWNEAASEFRYIGPNPGADPALARAFAAAVKDRADAQLHAYWRRSGPGRFVFPVIPVSGAAESETGSQRRTVCVMFGQDRAGLPAGWHLVAINGKHLYGKFVKVALNVLRSAPTDSRDVPNVLTTELESLFGGRLPVRPRVRFVKATSSAVWQIHRA
jgi:hypothetical protein